MKPEFAQLPYRPGVGIVLLNEAGLVWLGQRVKKWDVDGSAHLWQMPQGGIDDGETPRDAALRELEEEVGTAHAEIIAETAGWLTYDLPEEAMGIALKGRYRGQKQKWFALRFLGRDGDINLDTPNPEFLSWRWLPPGELTDLIVPFKRALYRDVLAEFAGLLRR